MQCAACARASDSELERRVRRLLDCMSFCRRELGDIDAISEGYKVCHDSDSRSCLRKRGLLCRGGTAKGLTAGGGRVCDTGAIIPDPGENVGEPGGGSARGDDAAGKWFRGVVSGEKERRDCWPWR